MNRSTIDHTRGRLTPGAKLPRIANRIPTQRSRVPPYEERQEMFRRIRRAAAASIPPAATVVEANQRVLDRFAVPGVEFYQQRGGFVGDVFIGPRVIAVPDDAPRTRTEYRGMLVDGRCVTVPVEVPIDYSAPPRVDQRVIRSGPRPNERSFVGPGRVVGDEGVVISTGPMGGWSVRTVCGPRGCRPVFTQHAPAVAEVDPILLAGLEREPAPAPPADALESIRRGDVPAVDLEDLKAVADSDDPELIRATAIGAILSGHVSQGLDALAKVYRENPGLAAEPLAIDGRELQRAMRRAQSRVMSAANREDTLFAWTGAAAFVQHVEGQNGVLKRSVERGTRVGLFGELAETSSWKGL